MSVSWDMTFSSGDECDSPEVACMFFAAVSERVAAAGSSLVNNGDGTFTITTPSTTQTGNPADVADPQFVFNPAPGGDLSASSWPTLQRLVIELSKLYIPKAFDPDGYGLDTFCDFARAAYEYYGLTPPTPDNFSNENLVVVNPPTLYLRLPAWPGGGFTRRREREISSLDAPGDEGQRARFVWAATDWDISSPISPEPAVPIISASATADRQYSKKFFDFVDGEWVLSGDQASDPDIVTYRGLAVAGDIKGPWILNELRDAINELTRTWVSADLIDCRREPAKCFPEKVLMIQSIAGGSLEGDLTAFANPYGGIQPIATRWYSGNGNSGKTSEFHLFATPAAFCARSAKFYLMAWPPNFYGNVQLFDPQGSSLAVRAAGYGSANQFIAQLNAVGDVVATSDQYLVSPKIGDANAVPPNGASETFYGVGWQVTPTAFTDGGGPTAIAVIDWDVPGGFKYVSGATTVDCPGDPLVIAASPCIGGGGCFEGTGTGGTGDPGTGGTGG
ncbi:MAG: hypothetical protein ACTHM6_03015, partial [Tepidisphaeraceae bacterium]